MLLSQRAFFWRLALVAACSIFWAFRPGGKDAAPGSLQGIAADEYDSEDDLEDNELQGRRVPPPDNDFDPEDQGPEEESMSDDNEPEFCEQTPLPDSGSDSWRDEDESVDNHSISQLNASYGPNFPPTRRQSSSTDCRPTLGPRESPDFLDMVRPCGYWTARCQDLPVVEANRDYPGGGPTGAVVPNQDYVVQFDIGLHPEVARDVLRRHFRQIDTCMNCPTHQETCLEAVVTGGSMWGDLGVRGVHPKAYNCMGSCGRGCAGVRLLKTQDDVGALDCLKHDLCSAWKSVRLGEGTQGFCHDPDCGDEAAMSIFNCWKGFRMFGAVGGSRNGPFATPHICDNTTVGCWSHGGWFTKGRCTIFAGWHKGQGIPDRKRFR